MFNKNVEKLLEKKFDEFEIRIKVAEDKILKYYNENKSDKRICSVVLQYGNKRRESFYNEKYEKIKHIDIEKIEVGSYKFAEFKFTASTEKEITTFNTALVKNIKLKDRYVYMREDGHFDLTFIKVIKYNSNISGLKETIIEFFSSKKEKDIELEYEFNKPTIKAVENILLYCFNTFGAEYLYKHYLNEIKNILHIKNDVSSVKQVGNNPVLLDRTTFNKINIKNYFVLEKTDGKRGFIKYSKAGYVIITEENIEIKGNIDNDDFHIFDCEIMEDKIFIFDVMIFDGIKLTVPYINRMALLGKLKMPPEFRIKSYYEPTCENLNKILRSKNIDGIIFNEKTGSYLEMHIYKWKPAELITFDFLIMPMPYKGIKPYISDKNLYILMCGCVMKDFIKLNIKLPVQYKELLSNNGIRMGAYNPIPFATALWPESFIYESDDVMGLCVGEFSLDFKAKKWKLLKIREDKTLLIKKGIYGNDFFVAEKHFNEVQNPLTKEEICSNRLGGGYFEKNKNLDYKTMAQFNGYVKFNIMKILSGIKVVLDIASGKGQDIFIYNGLQVGKCYFVEPDKNAVIELTDRLRKLDDEKFYKHTARPLHNMKYEVINSDYENFIKTDINKYNAIVCNFAIHYILAKPEDYTVFSNYCFERGAEIVILTYFDSEIVKLHLPFVNEKFDVSMDKGRFKVKHHFASEPYYEYIVDTNLLIKNMSQKYDLIMRDSFGAYLKERPISEPDSTYCSFYQYVVFRKKN